MDLNDFSWSDEVVDPRPLRRLGLVSGATVAAVVVVLVGDRHSVRHELGPWVVLVWAIGLVAALLLVGAVAGLWSRHVDRTGRRREPAELRAELLALARLRRGDPVTPELLDAAQRVVDDQHHRGRLILTTVFGVFWAGSAFTYDGWDFWLHLGLGVAYLAFTVTRWWQRSRVLTTGARWGVTPRRQHARRWRP